MKYVDEEILRNKKLEEAQKENEKENNEQGDIDSLDVKYERRYYLDGKVSLEVPIDCKEVPEETVEILFYGENKPQYVIESESTEVAVGYNYSEHEISNDDIFRFAGFAAKMLETMGPGVKVYKIKNKKRQNFNLSVVEFTSKGLDGGIYNQMFYVSVEGKLMINFVVLPSEKASKLRGIADYIVESFNVETDIK